MLLSHMRLFLFIIFISIAIQAAFCAHRADSLVSNYFETQEISQASTGRECLFLTSLEKRTLVYINLARMCPKKFAQFYKAYLSQFDLNGLEKLRRKEHYHYSLYTYLLRKSASKPLMPNQKMQTLAACWAKESGRKGIIGHNRTNCDKGYRGECCNYSYNDDALEHVMDLLIDESVASLGHRKILLSNNYSMIGISYQPHKKYKYCSVYDLR